MKAKRVYYEKCFSLGNFENQKVGIEIEIEKGEFAKMAIDKAMVYVERYNPNNEKEYKYRDACAILRNKENSTYKQVTDAEAIVKKYEEEKEINLPF